MAEPTDKPDAEQPEQGFRVTDRRRAGRDAEAPAKQAETVPPDEARAGPPLDFTTFLLSLASNALIQMGAAPDPETNATSKNLLFARQTVDLLGMLREKTRGNLTDEETHFFDALLYDLRLRFVEAQKAG
jgi:hypothetical protein